MNQDITSALQEQFIAQSRSSWHRIQVSRFAELRQMARSVMWRNPVWDWEELCISSLARQAAQCLEFAPSEVFAHPQALADVPELEEYYRLLACLSAKNVAQIVSANGRPNFSALSMLLNVAVSSRLEGMVIGSRQSSLYDICGGGNRMAGYAKALIVANGTPNIRFELWCPDFGKWLFWPTTFEVDGHDSWWQIQV